MRLGLREWGKGLILFLTSLLLDMASNEDKMQFLSNPAGNFSAADLEGDLVSTSVKKNPKPATPSTMSNPAATILNLGQVLAGGVDLGGGASSSPSSQQRAPVEYVSTLDEPVSVTIMRDVKAIGQKLGHVFFPKNSDILLKDWDLWGPLSLCVILSILLQGNSEKNKNAPEFAGVFALITMGAIVVTINTKLLSGKISIFQSICVLGYCLLPLVLVSMLGEMILVILSRSAFSFALRLLLVSGACGWSVYASTGFLADDTINLPNRKALAIFPIFLFYFVISWLIILHTN